MTCAKTSAVPTSPARSGQSAVVPAARKTLLLFDLDGTLWDSAANVAEAWNEIFLREDPSLPPLTTEDIHSVMGLTMREIQDVLHPSIPAEKRDRIFEECNRYEVEYLRLHGGTVYPGLREVLEALRGRGFTLGIVSNCQCGYIDAFLKSSGVGDLIADWEEWERTGLVKGKNIRLVMERNGFDQAVYIGDTAKDEEAANLAGLPFIHAAYGFGRGQHPVGVLSALTELPALIDRLNLD